MSNFTDINITEQYIDEKGIHDRKEFIVRDYVESNYVSKN